MSPVQMFYLTEESQKSYGKKEKKPYRKKTKKLHRKKAKQKKNLIRKRNFLSPEIFEPRSISSVLLPQKDGKNSQETSPVLYSS